MKAGFRAFLVLCHVGALICAAMGARLIFNGGSGASRVFAAMVVSLAALALQYVFLAFWNPLKLFQRPQDETADTEITRAPWGN